MKGQTAMLLYQYNNGSEKKTLNTFCASALEGSSEEMGGNGAQFGKLVNKMLKLSISIRAASKITFKTILDSWIGLLI